MSSEEEEQGQMKSTDTASTKSEDFKSEVSGLIWSSSSCDFSFFPTPTSPSDSALLLPFDPSLLLPIAGVTRLHHQLLLQTNTSFFPPQGLGLQVGKQQSKNRRLSLTWSHFTDVTLFLSLPRAETQTPPVSVAEPPHGRLQVKYGNHWNKHREQ